ncbi:threonine/homoserine/homoserine lactone efflux protein [Nocardiopsis sp. Huas11]|uniref:LysE family translocator n=1 Tax=Nocardiopsis sp. Huas11 TaxID=2183912 RepID=UPI000EB53A97|nr:LysE family transporter [Nocardiopsis sp. Huas11]RKS08808.1 threonine/homoserine/homoserine lactone efflux protein [Nocardiopsis sp. Huas11]
MATTSIAGFWAVSVLLVLVPGADWAYTIAAGLRDRSVLPAVGGLMVGYAALTGVVAAGVAALIASTPAVLTALTALGALYLTWLGVATLRRPPAPAASAEAGPAAPWVRRVLIGAGTSGLNPKGLLLFLALLPQFTDQDGAWPPAAQIGALGLVHTLSCGAVYACVGVLARTVLHARPAAARAVARTSGVAMIVIGAALLVERLSG